MADPYPRSGSALSRSFLPLALITLGVVFLLSNLVPDRGRGGLILFGLGAAFAVGRVTTGRYGYAVPAGLLMAIGIYVGVHDYNPAINSGGLFFVLLGLGFFAAYAVGLRPASIWPLFPAVILLVLGLIVLAAASLGPLASLSWIAAYWPAALVLIGVWMLLREALPAPVRKPIATMGGLALLAYGVVAAAANVAAGGVLPEAPITPNSAPFGFGDRMTLDQPISAGQTLGVTSGSGTTTLRMGNGSTVHVVASQHRGSQARLTPTSSGLSLDNSGSGEETIDVPAGVNVSIRSASGKVNITLPSDSAVTLDIKSDSGRVEPQGALQLANGSTSRNQLSGVVGGTSSTTTLSVHTTSGNVVVKR